MLVVETTTKFRRQLKLVKRRGKDVAKLESAVELIAAEKSLPHRYRVHLLVGEWFGCWECHLEPDWLLVWSVADDVLTLQGTGSHDDIFG